MSFGALEIDVRRGRLNHAKGSPQPCEGVATTVRWVRTKSAVPTNKECGADEPRHGTVVSPAPHSFQTPFRSTNHSQCRRGVSHRQSEKPKRNNQPKQPASNQKQAPCEGLTPHGPNTALFSHPFRMPTEGPTPSCRQPCQSRLAGCLNHH